MHAVPQHIHFVVQPVTEARMSEFGGLRGARLQVAMFDGNESPPEAEVDAIASRLRAWFDGDLR